MACCFLLLLMVDYESVFAPRVLLAGHCFLSAVDMLSFLIGGRAMWASRLRRRGVLGNGHVLGLPCMCCIAQAATCDC